jgi:VIT1/CCC1 family predicted Fe2+/Mn2+ transporter
MVGVAAAGTGQAELLVTGMAGLVAGAMSMAAGEYVSVRSQADTEHADVGRERAELAAQPDLERQELASIYVARGLAPDLAARVAEQLMAHDALSAHTRDELGISPGGTARPVQASVTSAASFAAGSAFPVLTALVVSPSMVLPMVAGASLVLLAALGALAARVGRAPVLRASIRVAVLVGLVMSVTAGIGRLFGAVV